MEKCKHAPYIKYYYKCKEEYSFLKAQTCKYCGETICPELTGKTYRHIRWLSFLCTQPHIIVTIILVWVFKYYCNFSTDYWFIYMALGVTAFTVSLLLTNKFTNSTICRYLNAKTIWVKSEDISAEYRDIVDTTQAIPQVNRFHSIDDR